MDSLERLQGLHADLIAFSETKLANIDRLWQELEDTLDDFRRLLDPPATTPKDQELYTANKVAVKDEEYSISDEFKHIGRALATAVSVNEIQAGKILVQDYGEEVSADLDFIARAVADFHDRRDLLLQDLRMVLDQSGNLDLEEPFRDGFQQMVKMALEVDKGVHGNASRFVDKCLEAMQAIEARHAEVTAQLQSVPTTGELKPPAEYAIMDYQRKSLFKQHEALACIVTYLFRGNYAQAEDLRKVESVIRHQKDPKLDFMLVHYLPVFAEAARQIGGSDLGVPDGQLTSLNGLFRNLKRDHPMASIEPFQAAQTLIWTAQFSSHCSPGKTEAPEAKDCAASVKVALEDNALEFLLAICSSMISDTWRHPARQEMVALLLTESPDLALDGTQTSQYFREMLMESLESFTESWISNMPDSIRRLKSEEDDQRLAQIAAMQEGVAPDPRTTNTSSLHLESFLILMSFAFEHRPEASEQWWEDPESNLYGFLQWASKRQTVPRVSAFCEMLCSIAEGEDGASSAHKFLLDESVPMPGFRTRRMPTMNYQQMFAELDLYARKVHEKPSSSGIANRKVLPTDMNEVESPVMLSSYLRLLAHLCRHTPLTREFIFSNITIDLPRVLLLLSSGPVPTYLRASVFAFLEALLTDALPQTMFTMWRTIDEWASSSHDAARIVGGTGVQPPTTSTVGALQGTLASVSSSPDQYDAFIILLRRLLSQSADISSETQMLPFPEDLGSAYRSAGVTPYIDFICGQILVKRLPEASDESQALSCAFHCLDLVANSLESFNESYVAMLDRSGSNQNSTQPILATGVYIQRHPFARLMQWILSSDMNVQLMKRLHVPIADIEATAPDLPLLLTLQRSIDVVNLVMDLQPTYMDIVRPLVKDLPQQKMILGVTSMEDSIYNHTDVILDLCNYATVEYLDLSLRALSLLQKLSGSTKLNNNFLSAHQARGHPRRILDMLGPNATADLRVVSNALVAKLHVNERELENGPSSPGYLLKDGILAFLNTCLETEPEFANVAHILLGFRRLGNQLSLTEMEANESSVLDAVIELVRDYPHGEENVYISWLVHVKTASMMVLRSLWSSVVSAEATLSQLRRYRLLPALFASQESITESSSWDGRTVLDEDFWFVVRSETMTELLKFRSCLYKYVSHELRASSSERSSSVLKQHLSTIMGKSLDLGGAPINHLSIFDLGDFMDINLSVSIDVPPTQYLPQFDPEAYMTEATDEQPSLYDIPMAHELVQMQASAVGGQSQSQVATQSELDQFKYESEMLLACLTARNRLVLARQTWRETLRQYVDMVIAVVEFCPMDATAKTQFILQMLQLMLPKLDTLVAEDSEDTVELVRAADTLMFEVSRVQNESGMENMITEKLFQLFRTCIDGVLMANTNTALRGLLYSICSQYLTRITSATAEGRQEANDKARANSMDCVRSSNLRLITVLSDDAEDGTESCRLNALNLLALLTSLARLQGTNYIIDALVKANVLEILIEPLKYLVTDFQDTDTARKLTLPI